MNLNGMQYVEFEAWKKSNLEKKKNTCLLRD